MTNSVDPVSAGLVASLARPGGNVAGVASTRRADRQTADHGGAAAAQARAWVESCCRLGEAGCWRPGFWVPEPPRCTVYEVGASSLVGAAACSAGDTAACSGGGSPTGSAGCGAACCSAAAGASGSAAGCSMPPLPSFAVNVTSLCWRRGIRRFFSSTSAVRTLDGDVAFGLGQVDEQTCRVLVR